MNQYCFFGGLAEVSFGLGELEKEGCFVRKESGFPVEVRKGGNLCAESDGSKAVLTFETRVGFFRALGILLEHEPGEAFRRTETSVFRTCGGMFDISRNAVLKQEGFEFFIRRMALMGLNAAMLYMEDTYEVPGEPYFGCFRGRCSAEELRRMDDYAFAFGIELIPAIQTLAHLAKVLRWQVCDVYRDTGDILMVGDERVLALVEKMIRAVSAPLRTKRIHLGMDEAEGIGGGAYLRRNGYRPKLELLNEHLRSVVQICRKLGLQPMIWSDMYLKLLSADGTDYYDMSGAEQPLPREVTEKMPADVSLVYWDYDHKKESEYETLLKKHRRFPNEVVFAGGAHTWGSIAPVLGEAFICTIAALDAAQATGTRDVYCTMWGDDGAETSMLGALPVLQLYAEHAWQGKTPESDDFAKRFRACCGADFYDFWALRLFDETPGVEKNNPLHCNPSKYLLYQDVLLGLFDRHTEGLPLDQWYRDLAARMADAEKSSPKYAVLFKHYHILAELLSRKALLGAKTTEAYRSGDREALRNCAETCGRLCSEVKQLEAAWSALWFSLYKPFGFERIDLRLGGMIMRLESAKKRIEEYLAGEVSSLPELEEPRLFFDGRIEAGEFPITYYNCWDGTVSVS